MSCSGSASEACGGDYKVSLLKLGPVKVRVFRLGEKVETCRVFAQYYVSASESRETHCLAFAPIFLFPT